MAADINGCQWGGCRGGNIADIRLARIRRLVPKSRDQHYDKIVRNFGVGALRPPPTPMSDGELARVIAEFLKEAPSSESIAILGRRIDPTSPV